MKNKKLLLILTFPFFLIVLIISFNVFINIKYDKSLIENRIIKIASEKLDREIYFDNIDVDFFGNVVLKNFKMSFDKDFNNNDSVLLCEDVTLYFGFYPMLKGAMQLSEIKFANGNIKIVKQFGKSHNNILDNLNFLKDKITSFDVYNEANDNFIISFDNLDLIYVETFKNGEKILSLTDCDSKVAISKDKIVYKFESRVPHVFGKKKDGFFNIKGQYQKNNKKWQFKSVGSDLDSVYIGFFLQGYKLANLNPQGDFSFNFDVLNSDKDAVKLNGFLQTSNFYLRTVEKKPHIIVYNGNLTLDVSAKIERQKNIVFIDELSIFNDSFKLKLNGL